MKRYYANSRPKFLGRQQETYVVDRERTSDKTGGPLIVVDTHGDMRLAERIALLLRRHPDRPVSDAPEGNYRAQAKRTGKLFSGSAAYLLRRRDQVATTYSANGPVESRRENWITCADVVDLELAERVAALLNRDESIPAG